MKNIFTIVMLAAWLFFSGCSDPDRFTVEGQIEGVDSQSITLTYFSTGGLKSTSLSARQGKFAFSGTAPAPSLAYITIAPENVRIATFVVKNGDRIEIKADLNKPLESKISGNKESEETSRWINDNIDALKSRNAEAINKAIADYVHANPKKLSSTAILTGFFHSAGYENTADSLFSSLSREVRQPEMTQAFNSVISAYVGIQSKTPVPFMTMYERRDSMVNINPMRHSTTLLCIVSDDRKSRDSITTHLRSLTDEFNRKRLLAVEISTAPDSASWRNSIGRDTVSWPQTWVKGSVSSEPLRKLSVSRVPFFIVADSTGQSIYRGPSIRKAAEIIREKL